LSTKSVFPLVVFRDDPFPRTATVNNQIPVGLYLGAQLLLAGVGDDAQRLDYIEPMARNLRPVLVEVEVPTLGVVPNIKNPKQLGNYETGGNTAEVRILH